MEGISTALDLLIELLEESRTELQNMEAEKIANEAELHHIQTKMRL